MKRVCVLTGGSSGIGKATALLLANNGFTVYELSRKGADADGIFHITADVTEPEQVKAAVTQVLAAEGQIDLLVNNAGFGISGAVEFTDPKEAFSQLNVNFFGSLNCIQAVLPTMRAQKGGHIVNISSVAAPIAIPFQSFYSATKAATNSLTLALRNEVKPFGVKVCAILPGDVKTGFTAARRRAARERMSMVRRSTTRSPSWSTTSKTACHPNWWQRRCSARLLPRTPRRLQPSGSNIRCLCCSTSFYRRLGSTRSSA